MERATVEQTSPPSRRVSAAKITELTADGIAATRSRRPVSFPSSRGTHIIVGPSLSREATPTTPRKWSQARGACTCRQEMRVGAVRQSARASPPSPAASKHKAAPRSRGIFWRTITGIWSPTLYRDDDFHLAGAAGHSQGDFVFMSIEHEVETRGSDGEVPNLDSLKKRRQHRTDETHQAMRCVDS